MLIIKAHDRRLWAYTKLYKPFVIPFTKDNLTFDVTFNVLFMYT